MELTHDGYINGSHENEWNLIDLQIIDLHLEWHEWKIKEQEKHMKQHALIYYLPRIGME